MPASRWLRSELAGVTRSVLTSSAAVGRGYFRPQRINAMLDEHLSGQRDWGNVLWTALVLEVWHLLFVDRSLSRSDALSVLA
jgi:hypothetical protein